MAKKEFTELKNPGQVTLYNKKTGKDSQHFPVDANEILEQENSPYTMDPDEIKIAQETAKGKRNVKDMDEIQEEAELSEDESDAADEVAEDTEDYSTWKKADLFAEAEAKGLEPKTAMNKEELIELLESDDE